MSNACSVSKAIEKQTILGKSTQYVDTYKPELLFPIARELGRASLALKTFIGYDLWRLYEVTWLDQNGLPHVAFGTLKVPATSPSIVESKSLKLYVGSFTQSIFDSIEAVAKTMEKDISAALETPVEVSLTELNALTPEVMSLQSPEGINLEQTYGAQLTCTEYGVTPALLKVNPETHVSEVVHSNLLRSRCPVTGQPDHATVTIAYTGPELDKAALLAYIVSYRHHQGFHEQCAEQIFSDLSTLASFKELTVSCSFTRRGGIDISPVRSSKLELISTPKRTPRQ